MISTDIGIWTAAIFTLFVYSYFTSAKQNIAFRFAQSTVVGIALGYIFAIALVKNVDYLAIQKIQMGDVTYIIPILLGLLFYTKYIPKYSYLARTPIAWIISVGLGVGARGALETDIFKTMLSSSKWLVLGNNTYDALNSIVLIIGLLAGVSYFFFTIDTSKNKGLNAWVTLGRYYLMIYFGAKFGLTILSRLTLFTGRMQFLLFDWLGL